VRPGSENIRCRSQGFTQPTIAANFAAQTDGYGLSGEQERIANSITAIAHGLAEQYIGFITDNPDYAGIADTEYAWLKDDKEFMAFQLQQAFIAQDPAAEAQATPNSPGGVGDSGETAESLYTLEELTYLGRFIDVLNGGMRDACLIATESGVEARAGIVLGMASVMAETFTRQTFVSERLKSAIERAAAGFGESFMNECDRRREYSNSRRHKWSTVYYSPLNREDVLSIYRAMLNEMLASGSASQAFERGVKECQRLNYFPPSNYVSSIPAAPPNSNGSAVKILNLQWPVAPNPNEPTGIQVINLQWNGFMNYMRTGEHILPNYFAGLYNAGLYNGFGDFKLALSYGKQLDLRV
jgi:hypothetical protein